MSKPILLSNLSLTHFSILFFIFIFCHCHSSEEKHSQNDQIEKNTIAPPTKDAKQTGPSTYRLYFLGGQSNMEGFGDNKDIPRKLKKELKRIRIPIFNGNPVEDNAANGGVGRWDILKPGYGITFKSNGLENIYSYFFGPELTFATTIQKLYPNEKIAILKYAKGGASIQLGASKYATWTPDSIRGTSMNQYDFYLNTLKTALNETDIDKDGIEDVLIPAGIIWMQGESDADHTKATAEKYESNLRQLMDSIRVSLGVDDLPIVIGKVVDASGKETDDKVLGHIEIVQQAQANFVAKDVNATLMTATENYSFRDYWHYTSEGYLDLGEQFAKAIYELENNPKVNN